MKIQIATETVNLERMLRGIDKLAKLTQHRHTKEGLRRAGRHLRNVGRRELRMSIKGKKGTGNLYRSMSVKLKRRRSNAGGALVGFRRGKDGGNHAHLVDLGTKPRYTRRGKYRGRVAGSRFWTMTKERESRKAMDYVVGGIKQAVRSIPHE